MDLTSVPEIDADHAAKLREAGIPNAEVLAVWEDVDALAARAGLEREAVEAARDAARGALERALAEAGVSGPQDLALADVGALAERSGLDRAYLERYQRRAQDAAGRVVLAESAPVARVQIGEEVHHAVPLVTPGPGDEDDAVLARAGGDAVLLKPRAEVVPALIGGVTHRALALYKERRRGDGELEEVRVRVADVREVPERKETKKGGIGKLFSRKK